MRAARPLSIRHWCWPAVIATATALAPNCTPRATNDPDREDWIDLFNGRNLDDWTVKISTHDVNVNFANTFRVEDGILSVRYDGYGDFDDQFSHLFFNQPFSHYKISMDYRFVGEQQPGAPDWARRNSGVMLHSQDPNTVTRHQDFPISVEMQFLGGLGNDRARPTGNMCSPGTDIVLEGSVAETHCISSTSDTYNGDEWVRAEAIVLGDSLIVHMINGDTVLQYSKPHVGGGVVNGYDPTFKQDGTPLVEGFIALQSEGHPLDFRNIVLLNLKGCMDPNAGNFKRYYVASYSSACD